MTEPHGVAHQNTSAAALRAMRNLAEAWGVPLTAMSTLSGLALEHWPSEDPLTADQAERVGLLLNVYRSLHELWDNDLADRWVTIENTNELYGGRRPIDLMTEGGVSALVETAKLLAGRVQGQT